MKASKKIRILRIIARLNIGGPAVHTALLTKELNDEEYESKLLCGSISEKEGDMAYILDSYDVHPIFIPQLKRNINLFYDTITLFRLFKIMMRYKPHIVHTHTAKAGALGRLAAVFARVPVKIHTFHGNIFYGYFGKLSTKVFMHIERILAKFTDAVITVSPCQKKEITEKYKITDPDKCLVTKLGLDLDKFLYSNNKKNIIRDKFGFSERDILVGIIGRLTAVKNHKMFIDAAAHIKETAEKDIAGRIKFVIIGDGELKTDLLKYTALKNLNDSLFFTGWIKNMSEAYQDLDIVALTSLNEGTPVSLIEAMASSKPVVSTDAGGVKDVVGDIGILVDSGDYRAMGDEILKLCASREKRENLGMRGREYVSHAYSKEGLLKDLRGLYGGLLAKKLSKEK